MHKEMDQSISLHVYVYATMQVYLEKCQRLECTGIMSQISSKYK